MQYYTGARLRVARGTRDSDCPVRREKSETKNARAIGSTNRKCYATRPDAETNRANLPQYMQAMRVQSIVLYRHRETEPVWAVAVSCARSCTRMHARSATVQQKIRSRRESWKAIAIEHM